MTAIDNSETELEFDIQREVSLRIRSLTNEDKADIEELAGLISKHRDGCSEEFEAAIAGFAEILFKPTPCTLVPFLLSTSPDALTNWKRFVSNRIKAARELKGLTQSELARLANLPQSHISRLESAKHSPSHSTLEKIARALDLPMTEFDPNAPE